MAFDVELYQSGATAAAGKYEMGKNTMDKKVKPALNVRALRFEGFKTLFLVIFCVSFFSLSLILSLCPSRLSVCARFHFPGHCAVHSLEYDA